MTAKRTAFFRIVCLMVIAAAAFLGLMGRLYYLQIIQAAEIKSSNRSARTFVKPLPAERGYILDRSQQPLALNKTVYTIGLDKRFVPENENGKKQVRETLNQVKQVLDLSGQEIEAHVKALEEKQARELRRGVSEEKKRAVMAMEIPGVYSDPSSTRFYPEESLAAHVLGYTGTNNVGRAGLEWELGDQLKGQPFVIHGEKDSGRRLIANKDFSEYSTRGMDAVLTIDNYIQFVVEREIKKTRQRTNALQVNAVVMHPKSGEILALANYPAFDPNRYSEYPEKIRKNTLLTDVFEPGSVMKPFTVIAALDQGTVTPSTVFDCSDGYFEEYRRRIRDDIHEFEYLTVHDILVRSSNIGAVKIAQTLGRDKKDWRGQAHVLREYFRRFGFKHHGEPNAKSTCELPGESVGTLKPLREWWPSSMASVPYGQEMSTNTLILTAAYSTIANRGVYVPPTIVKGFLGKEGAFYQTKRDKPRRVVSSRSVEPVVSMLVDVTEDPEGTGHRHVRIPGFHVAGKTGTAQKVDPQTGAYGRGMRVSSFAGFFPAYDPAVAIVVVVNEPKGLKYGGETAGPAWKAIAEEIAAYWGLSPSFKNDPLLAQKKDVALSNKTREPGQAKTFGVTQIAKVPKQRQLPAVIEQMPDLAGMAKRDAYALLAMNGLNAEFEGFGKVVYQETKAGAPLGDQTNVGRVVCAPMLTDPSVPPDTAQVARR